MRHDTPPRSMQELVDLHSGCISREIFVNADIYQQEQEQVFTRAWLFIGHESQIPKPGDYFVTCMGEESVILTRDAKGVAQLANYKGSLWATWDKEAPPFLEYLGDMKLYLDVLLDCRDGREGGSEVLGGIQKWYMPCNWKFAAENFIGDAYHNISHRSVDMVGIGPSGRGRRDTEERTSSQRVAASFPALGHGATSFL